MILLWRRPGEKSFLIVYCALFSLTWFGDCSILYVFQQWQHKGSLKLSRRHGEHSLQIEIWNTATSGDFIKFSECQVPMSKCKAPHSEDFLPTVLVSISYAFARPFRCDQRSILSSLKKEKTCEPRTYQLQPFGCVLLRRVSLVCVRFLHPW